MKLRVAVLVVGGILSVAGTAYAVSDTYGGATFHPFTMPGDTGCVPWNEPGEGTTYNCDPVNVIFPNQTWTRVRDRLRARGWTTFGFGSNQYLHFASSTLVRQSVQLFRSDGSGKRYHMRVWQTGTTTLAGVHHETGTFVHTIDKSWDDSEAFVVSQLCAASCSTAYLPEQWRMQSGDLLWRGWRNDATAAVIP